MKNLIILKTIPEGEFEEISIENATWRARFKAMIQERKKLNIESILCRIFRQKFRTIWHRKDMPMPF